jgi:hypothetical protein
MWPSEGPWPRAAVLREALAFFGIREVYNSKVKEWNRQVLEQKTLQAIKDGIPAEGERKIRIMKAIKRWVTFQNGVPLMRDVSDPRETIETSPEWIAELFDSHRLKEFLGWVRANSAELNSRERRRNVIKANARADVERRRDRCGN